MELDYRKSYQEYKAELDRELGQMAEKFVRIGYLLKIARDTEILRESGYANVVEFAKAEYGIDKTQVSRFININDRFAKDGYSDSLEEHYKGFGYAKLSIMLQLPDSINEELTADYSKAEIQTIKEELDEEKQISDIEVILEGTEERIEDITGDLRRTILQLGEDEPKLYADIWTAKRQQDWGIPVLQALLTPLGQKQYSIRIRGIGRKLLIMKDADNENTVSLVDLRSNDKQTYTWEDVQEAWGSIVDKAEGYQAAWEETYLSAWPIEEVAPVQQTSKNQVQPKTAPKKETKVQKAKPVKKEPEKQPQQTEEQLIGQASIEDYPEYMPETQEEPAVQEETIVQEEPAAVQEETGVQAAEQSTNSEKPLDEVCDIWNNIVDALQDVQEFMDRNCYKSAEELYEKDWTEAYNSAINVAAGFERLMTMRRENRDE